MNVCPTLLPEDQNFVITLPSPPEQNSAQMLLSLVYPSAHSNCPLAITLLPSLTNLHLLPASLYQRDERAMPGNPQSSEIFCSSFHPIIIIIIMCKKVRAYDIKKWKKE